MENTYENEIEINLRDIFYEWKRRIFLILAIGILAACVCCCFMTLFVTPLYTSTATLLVLIVDGDLNGPTIGGIFTIVGFSTTGKHLRNIAPIMLGVVVAGISKDWEVNEPSPMLALLFSTTLAPVAGEFGILVGMLAGFLHSSVALNVGMVYGGMNLYNNGFAGGIVAIFMVPVIQSIMDRRARAKSNLSL